MTLLDATVALLVGAGYVTMCMGCGFLFGHAVAALAAAAWRTGHLDKLCEAIGDIIAGLGK